MVVSFALARRIAHLDGRYTALKAHVVLGMVVDRSSQSDLGDLKASGQRVYDRCRPPDTPCSRSRHELAACVQDGEHNLERRNAHLRVNTAGNAAAVVGNADDIALFDRNFDVRAVACERLVDRVIDDPYTRWCRPRAEVEPMRYDTRALAEPSNLPPACRTVNLIFIICG